MELPTVVFVDRWSLYRGALVSLRWPMEQPTVVTIDNWSSYTSGLEGTCFSVFSLLVNCIQMLACNGTGIIKEHMSPSLNAACHSYLQ